MHELSITESILNIALQNTPPGKCVTDIHLVIGQFSSIVDDSVQFYWDTMSEDTPAQGSKLHFQRIPAELQCLTCQHTFAPGKDDFDCPACKSSHVKVIKGEEFYVEAIEVDERRA
jgi:hydrogenase nickel incorporation protein HypA/HybF